MAISTKPKTVIKRDKHNAKKSAPTLTSSLKASSAAATKATKAKASSAPAAVPAASIKGKEVATGPELDPNDVAYDKIYSKTRKIMGRKPIHAEEQNRVDHILRVFDLDISYGPCVGMSRLERWQRAQDLDLDPPEEVREILLTKQGQSDERYALDVFRGHAV